MQHQMRADRRGSAPRAAQLADRVALVAMHALADQRLPAALGAARARRVARVTPLRSSARSRSCSDEPAKGRNMAFFSG